MENPQPAVPKERILEMGSFLVTITDPEGSILYSNDEFAQISGFSKEALLHHSHRLVRHPDMPAALFGALWSALTAGLTWTCVLKNRCRNGDFYWAHTYIAPIKKNGCTTGFISVQTAPSRDMVEIARRMFEGGSDQG